jgi:hypothetical protein
MNAAAVKFAKEISQTVVGISGAALGGLVIANVVGLGLHATDVLQSHVSHQFEKLKPSKNG